MIKSGKIFFYIAVAYTIICTLQALVLPTFLETSIDNLLFPLAAINLFFSFMNFPKLRLLYFAFGGFFIWSVIAQVINVGGLDLAQIPYQLYIIKWLVIITTIYQLKKENSKYINIGVPLLFIATATLNVLMLVDWQEIGLTLQNLYSTKPYYNFVSYMQPGAFRLSGTQMNPNDNAAILAMFGFYFLKNLKKNAVYIVLTIVLLLLTQSRTVLLLFVVIGGLIVIRPFLQMKLKNKVAILSIVIVAIVIAVSSSSNIRSVFSGEAFSSHSLMVRFNNANSAFFENENLLFGNGVIVDPVKELGLHIDSEIVAVVLQYGFLGLILLMFVWFSIARVGRMNIIPIVFFVIGVSLTNYIILSPAVGVIVMLFLGEMMTRKEPDLQVTN